MQWFVYTTIFYYINRLAKEQSVNSWLPRQESNLGKRIQSPSCYLYTTRQYSFLPVYRCRRSVSNRHESRLSTVFETVASANSATPAKLERKTRLELATSSLARRRSTTELLPLILLIYWCRRRDLNPHRLSPTTPSRWRVYQLPPLRREQDTLK